MLQQIGVEFQVECSDVEEVKDASLNPEALVQKLALQKAQAVAVLHKDGLVLGADTIVVNDGLFFGASLPVKQRQRRCWAVCLANGIR